MIKKWIFESFHLEMFDQGRWHVTICNFWDNYCTVKIKVWTNIPLIPLNSKLIPFFLNKMNNFLLIFHRHSTIFPESTYYRDALCYVCGGSAVLGLISIIILRTTNLGRTHLYENLDEEPLQRPHIIHEVIDR